MPMNTGTSERAEIVMSTVPTLVPLGAELLTCSLRDTSAGVCVPSGWKPLFRSRPLIAVTPMPAARPPRPHSSTTMPTTIRTTFFAICPPYERTCVAGAKRRILAHCPIWSDYRGERLSRQTGDEVDGGRDDDRAEQVGQQRVEQRGPAHRRCPQAGVGDLVRHADGEGQVREVGVAGRYVVVEIHPADGRRVVEPGVPGGVE